MRTILNILFILILLGGAGFAVWHFFLKDQDLPFMPTRFPKEAKGLQDQIKIVGDEAFFVSASSRGDLLFAQGLSHGKTGGQELTALMRLFKGKTSPRLPDSLNQLSDLFFYLDLEHTAKASKEMYSPTLQMLLDQYAAGVSAGSGAEWQAEDALLMQRGYAFLLGRKFAAEWSANHISRLLGLPRFHAAFSYPQGPLGGVDSRVLLKPDLEVLFSAPYLEIVRGKDDQGRTTLHTRGLPELSWVFQPMGLQMGENLKVQGLSLAGAPFLWCGDNGAVSWLQLPFPSNNEQFNQIPSTLFSGQDDALFNNDDASMSDDYAENPMHARYGRRINPILSGSAGMEYFYYWDGFRPSADLTAYYYLLEAKDPDQAMSALQYHQTPAAEFTISRKDGPGFTIRAQSSDPAQTESMPSAAGLFQNPYLQRTKAEPWQGYDFHHRGAEKGDSPTDLELVSILRFYLEGPLAASMPESRRNQIVEVLRKGPSIERDYFIQILWKGLLDRFCESWLDEDHLYISGFAEQDLKKLLIRSLDRNASTESQNPVRSQIRLVESVVDASWRYWQRASKNKIEFPYMVPDENDLIAETAFPVSARSRDGAPAAFWVAEGNHLARIAFLRITTGDTLRIQRHQRIRNGEMGTFERIVLSADQGRESIVKPAP